MRRREFITLFGGATAAGWPLAARAQLPALPVIGFLGSETPELFVGRVEAFRHGLAEAGFVEGRNVAIEFRWAEGQYDRLPALATDLVRRRVSVIGAFGPAVPAAKAATTTIPIVFATAANPVEARYVASLSRPGGNLTGVTSLNTQLAPKRLELLRELLPAARSAAVLINPTGNRPAVFQQEAEAAGAELGLKIEVIHARSEREIENAFVTVEKLRADGLVVTASNFYAVRMGQVATLSVRHRIPTIFYYREFAAAGGLISYGGNQGETFSLAGVYTGRILKGEKPADLPVQQSTRVELIINLKTAKMFGLSVPLSLRARADEVIE